METRNPTVPWITLNEAISFLQSAQVLFSGLNSERGDKAGWVFHKIVIYPVDSAVYPKTRAWETPITIFKVPIILLEFLKDVNTFFLRYITRLTLEKGGESIWITFELSALSCIMQVGWWRRWKHKYWMLNFFLPRTLPVVLEQGKSAPIAPKQSHHYPCSLVDSYYFPSLLSYASRFTYHLKILIFSI